MNVINLNSVLAPEDVPKYFVLEGSRLYRKLASGGGVLLKSRDGNQIVTLFNGVRLLGVDIAWCLTYGNWPEFPVVQLREDPLDFSMGNLYPARIKRLRYVQKPVAHLFRHPLSSITHSTPERCRKHWEELARDFYMKDMPYVLRLEESNRALRDTFLRETGAVRLPETVAERPRRGSRPCALPGTEWHWYKDKWVNAPVACHVADDYRVRLQKLEQGATRFAFDPSTRRVKAYYPDGKECI